MKGILFQSEMIQAIVNGSKTQTRRVIKPQPVLDHIYEGKEIWNFAGSGLGIDCSPRYSRYQVDEVVYIKEAWRVVGRDSTDNKYRLQIQYKDGGRIWQEVSPIKWCWYTDNTGWGADSRWRSPLFMPEWAARYFIKITDVRAGRLQEISLDDVLAEGVMNIGVGGPTRTFQYLWNSINKDYQWESNPFIFRYEFVAQQSPSREG